MKISLLIFCFVLSLFTTVFADGQIEIAGIAIPLIPGAKILEQSKAQPNAMRIVTYFVQMPLAEAVSFYQSFLRQNNFLIIGGADNFGFNAAVKKDAAMFTLRIYQGRQGTEIQFVW